jgi:hypothetical protein
MAGEASDDHVTAEHEHSDDEEHEVDEAVLAQGLQLFVDSVAVLTGEDVDRLLRGLPGPVATDAVKDLLGNKLDPRRLKNVGSLLAGNLKKRPVGRQAQAVERLSTAIFATFETELGDRFENPSFDDLRDVMDAVLAEHPAGGVRCTLSWVVAQGMPAAEAARDLLVSDERLRLPAWAEAPPVPIDETGPIDQTGPID